MPRVVSKIGAVALWLGRVSCGDDGFNPTVDEVAGTYQATIFTFDGGSGATDLLAIGGEVVSQGQGVTEWAAVEKTGLAVARGDSGTK